MIIILSSTVQTGLGCYCTWTKKFRSETSKLSIYLCSSLPVLCTSIYCRFLAFERCFWDLVTFCWMFHFNFYQNEEIPTKIDINQFGALLLNRNNLNSPIRHMNVTVNFAVFVPWVFFFFFFIKLNFFFVRL